MKPQAKRLDKQKVAEGRQEEMKYFEATGVNKKVLYAQAIEEELDDDPQKWVDIEKADVRHRSRLVANSEAVDGEACSTRARTKEHTECTCRRQQFSHDARGRAQSVFLRIRAKPNTYVEVPKEDHTKESKVCGSLVKAICGTQQRRGKGDSDARSNMNPGASSPCVSSWSRGWIGPRSR